MHGSKLVPLLFALVSGEIHRGDVAFDFTKDACTTIIVGADATGDGGPLTSHTNDCASCDFRLSKVPAKTVDAAAGRDVYRYRAEYPRYVGDDKGATYAAPLADYYNWKHGKGDFKPMGTLPFGASRLNAFVDGAYGMMNEHDLAIGESTCGARITALPVSEGGRALVDARELSLIALERCETADCAVKLMGELAETHGFYGADATAGEGGEALTVVDREDAWVFHILADDTGASAVWAARRVPRDHVAVVANQFVITTLPPDEEGSLWLASKNIHAVATRSGLWDGKGEFNFLKIYGLGLKHLSTYATRRQWRVFDLAAPSRRFPGETDEWGSDYPFSVKVEGTLDAPRVMALLRDHYEGTPYDMTRGIESGPHGDPARWDMTGNLGVGYAVSSDGISTDEATSGKFERAISIFRCSYSFVSQSFGVSGHEEGKGATLWVAQYAPHAASYVPVWVAAEAVPDELATGSLHDVDHASLYWPAALAGNWAGRLYDVAYPIVQRTIDAVATEVFAAARRAEAKAAKASTHAEKAAILGAASNKTATLAREAWWTLFWDLASTVKDGQRIDDRHVEKLAPTKVFYPRRWLDEIHYFPRSAQDAWRVFEPKGSDVFGYAASFVLGACLAALAFARKARGGASSKPEANGHSTSYGVVPTNGDAGHA